MASNEFLRDPPEISSENRSDEEWRHKYSRSASVDQRWNRMAGYEWGSFLESRNYWNSNFQDSSAPSPNNPDSQTIEDYQNPSPSASTANIPATALVQQKCEFELHNQQKRKQGKNYSTFSWKNPELHTSEDRIFDSGRKWISVTPPYDPVEFENSNSEQPTTKKPRKHMENMGKIISFPSSYTWKFFSRNFDHFVRRNWGYQAGWFEGNRQRNGRAYQESYRYTLWSLKKNSSLFNSRCDSLSIEVLYTRNVAKMISFMKSCYNFRVVFKDDACTYPILSLFWL